MTYLLQGDDGQVNLTHSVSAGLDYAAIGPEHSYLRDQGRPNTRRRPTMKRWRHSIFLAREEGIMPALESAHAVAHTVKVAPRMKKNQILVVNLSGRGDKDVQQIGKHAREFCEGTVTLCSTVRLHSFSQRGHTFAQLRQRGEKALIAYVMAGDPCTARDGATCRGVRTGRGRSHRSGCAVFRSHRRRSCDPTGGRTSLTEWDITSTSFPWSRV